MVNALSYALVMAALSFGGAREKVCTEDSVFRKSLCHHFRSLFFHDAPGLGMPFLAFIQLHGQRRFVGFDEGFTIFWLNLKRFTELIRSPRPRRQPQIVGLKSQICHVLERTRKMVWC